MKCYLCGSTKYQQIHDRCRDSDAVKVLRCDACGLVFLSEHSKISDEFYAKSGMYDFEKIDRAKLLADEAADTYRRVELLRPLVKGKAFLDFGCGAGAILGAMKKLGSSVHGVELNEAHRAAIQSELGIEVAKDLDSLPETFDLISLFHVLEHLTDPVAVLQSIRTKLKDGGKVLIEVPHAADALLSFYDASAFKDFTYWTCHLFLFTESTLAQTLEKAGFGNVKIEFAQRYPLSNHLHWLAKGKPGGHKVWNEFSTPELDAAYAKRLAELKISDTLIATASI